MADGVSIDVSDINALAADLGKASGRAYAHATRAVAKTGQDIVATAQTFVPVDTGATRSSIHSTPSLSDGGTNLQAEVGPTTEYAPHLEYGTVSMAPRAFMGPALDRHTPDFVQAMEQIADGIFP